MKGAAQPPKEEGRLSRLLTRSRHTTWGNVPNKTRRKKCQSPARRREGSSSLPSLFRESPQNPDSPNANAHACLPAHAARLSLTPHCLEWRQETGLPSSPACRLPTVSAHVCLPACPCPGLRIRKFCPAHCHAVNVHNVAPPRHLFYSLLECLLQRPFSSQPRSFSVKCSQGV